MQLLQIWLGLGNVPNVQFLWNKWRSQLFLNVVICAFKIQRGTLQTQGCLFHFPFFCMALESISKTPRTCETILWAQWGVVPASRCFIPAQILCVQLHLGAAGELGAEEGTSWGLMIEAVLLGRSRRSSQPGPRSICERVCRCSCVGVKLFSNVFKPLLRFYFFYLMKCVLFFPFAIW